MMHDELVKRLRYCRNNAAVITDDELMAIADEAADAIEELRQTAEHYKGCADEWYKEACDYKAMIPRWIPVTERLPDTMKDKSGHSGWSAEIAPSDDVLCYLGSEKRQTVAWFSHTYKEWTTVDENTVYEYGQVTHWMPLLEPPKEE